MALEEATRIISTDTNPQYWRSARLKGRQRCLVSTAASLPHSEPCLATAIRTIVVVVMAWGMVFMTQSQSGIAGISRKSWIFLTLSGLATGASWLCYYRALQLGDASKVVPIDKLSVVITLALAFVFLREEFTAKSLIGCLLIAAGTLIMVI